MQLNLKFKSKIYGICSLSDASWEKQSRFAVVYGGKELAILTNLGTPNVEVVRCLQVSDWISTVHIYELIDGVTLRFCLLTSHSLAMEMELNESSVWKTANRSASMDKSTLYCSKVLGTNWSTTIVFGGTALGELIIWSVKSGDLAREIIHRVSGHNVSFERSTICLQFILRNNFGFQGVIFSVDCDMRYNLLTTTSDDRSVKIWAVNFTNKFQDWNSSALTTTKSMFGHTARIFAHKIIEFAGEPYIVSIGEDANICVWTRNGQLLHRQMIAGGNSTLWNLDWDPIRKYLITCGSNGNINQIPIDHILNRDVHRADIISTTFFSDDEHFAKIRVMQHCGLLVGVTKRHNLFYRQIDASDSQWHPVNHNDSKVSYKSTMLEVYGSIIAMAGYKRATIYQFNDEKFEILLDECLSNGMIRSMKFLDDDSFVVCDDKGNATFCTLNGSTKFAFLVPACKERWITVAHRYDRYLIIGDRCGNLHLYVIENEGIEWTNTLRHLHGSLGCTSVYFDSKQSNGRIEFKTAGHDGTLKTLWLDEQRKAMALRFTHRIPIAWTDKIVTLSDTERIIAGFNDNHFIALRPKCANGNEIQFEFECGGGHRYWDLYVDARGTQLKCHFYYIRTKQLHRVRFRLDRQLHPFDILHFNWHKRPCNVVRNIRLSDDRVLLASAGDDNLLKFNMFGNATTLCHVTDMSLHISNIKAICVVATKSGWLIFSAGGRAQICATELIVVGGDGSSDDDVQFCERANFMLRMNDLQRKRLGKSQNIDFDPETRFMSMIAYVNDAVHATWWLVVACSDGFIRRFVYDDRTSSIAFDSAVFYGRCILHVQRLQLNDDDGVLLSMATDGRICFWPLNEFTTMKSFYELSHHESGINSFDILIENNSSIYIATGGDDQSVVISRVKLLDRNVDVEKTVRFPYTHTAQVNGIKFNRCERALYSISVDQTIFRFDLNDFTVNEAGYTCVSDAKGLELINEDHVLAYGCGVQLLTISSGKN